MAQKYYGMDGTIFNNWTDCIEHNRWLEEQEGIKALREKEKMKRNITNAELIEILSKRPADEEFDINFEVEIWNEEGLALSSIHDLEGEGLCYSIEEDKFYMFGGNYDVS